MVLEAGTENLLQTLDLDPSVQAFVKPFISPAPLDSLESPGLEYKCGLIIRTTNAKPKKHTRSNKLKVM